IPITEQIMPGLGGWSARLSAATVEENLGAPGSSRQNDGVAVGSLQILMPVMTGIFWTSPSGCVDPFTRTLGHWSSVTWAPRRPSTLAVGEGAGAAPVSVQPARSTQPSAVAATAGALVRTPTARMVTGARPARQVPGEVRSADGTRDVPDDRILLWREEC